LSQSIDGTDAAADKLVEKLINNNPNFIKDNIKNINLRRTNEGHLKELKNRNISSVYILFPYDNRYFILLDSDNNKNITPFILSDIDIGSFKRAKKSKTTQVYIQTDIEDLGFTLIKPMLIKKKIVSFLVVDYTQRSYNSLISLLSVSAKIIMIILIILVIILTAFLGYFIGKAYLKHLSYINPNTGTFYRSYLTENYEKIDFVNYYIALADIDFFKRINDVYGQEIGDKVLNEIIKKIYKLLDKDDVFIQYGGEEFLLFISKNSKSMRRFRIKMEAIRRKVESLNIKIRGNTIKVTISIGGFIQTETSSSLQDAIHKADSALYESKHNGRNRVSYFDISKSKILYREKLKDMIEKDKLVCFYQPIAVLDTFEYHHYEALLRLQDGDKIIYPNEILPELEDSYFYSRISMKIIEYNVMKLRENTDFAVSINLSSDDLLNDEITNLLIKNSDVAYRMLVEILETKNVNYSEVENAIQKLKLFGYKICIDDYGSGYSNLSHLLNLSIDYLKIDGSIIRNIHKDKKAHSIIASLSLFCKQNGIRIIAEFVENWEILEILKGFGIEYGQGYYFDKAKPYEELTI
jgi:diguanylate cyclase (GGDEF)-like protein